MSNECDKRVVGDDVTYFMEIEIFFDNQEL